MTQEKEQEQFISYITERQTHEGKTPKVWGLIYF